MRTFIIGNGPSLRSVDLTKLPRKNTLVVACNRIQTGPNWERGFRPDVYVLGDAYGNKHLRTDLKTHLNEGYPCWVKSDVLFAVCNESMAPEHRLWWVDWKNCHPYQNCFHRRDMRPPTGWHPPNICNYTGAANAMVQVAVFEYDATEIFFLGIDGNYRKGNRGNHMSEEYQSTWFGPPMVERINDELYKGHSIIAEELEARGIPAVNLTPGSPFDQYESALLGSVLEAPLGVTL